MNLSLLDPFQNDFPEVIEEALEHGTTKCIAFNRRGTLLAAGCSNGTCVIWDFHTRGVTLELRDENCTSSILSVCWSKCGHRLLASALDKSLWCWDVGKGVKIFAGTLPQAAVHVRLNPSTDKTSLCLACSLSHAPILVDLNTGDKHFLPLSSSPPTTDATATTTSRTKNGEGSSSSGGNSYAAPSNATFNKRGDLIYVGNSRGEILIIDTDTRQVRSCVQVPGNATIRNIVFSRNGRHLLTNSSDRIIRVFENLLPREKAAEAVLMKQEYSSKGGEYSCLKLAKEFLDGVTRVHWRTACFSNDGEYVVGASANKGEHRIQIWNREFGQLQLTLEGPKDGVMDLAWHPNRPIVVSVSSSGIIYVWAKDYTENWSAFAPDFRELEENEEYVEQEDEFDLLPEVDKVKTAQIEEDVEVDIMKIERVAAFSDSDESDDGLHFLPTSPLPDTPPLPLSPLPDLPQQQHHHHPQQQQQQQQQQLSNHSDSNNDDSPASDEHNIPESSSLAAPEDEVGANGRMKRKRKLSEKAAELQAEIGRKFKGGGGGGGGGRQKRKST